MKQVPVRFRFDPFADRSDAQLGAHARHAAHERETAAVGFGGLEEAAVELQAIDIERAEVAKRGGACAEIIQRHANADGAQQRHSPRGRLDVADLGGFGDFDDEAVAREGVAGDGGAQFADDVEALERFTGDIDGEAVAGLGPVFELGRCGGHHDVVEVCDLAALLRGHDHADGRVFAVERASTSKWLIAPERVSTTGWRAAIRRPFITASRKRSASNSSAFSARMRLEAACAKS